MSELLILSKKIESTQEKLNNLSVRNSVLRQQLNAEYNAALDSLAHTENTNIELADQIKMKKILISPSLSRLSFDPPKLLALLNKENISEPEQKILHEYIAVALDDVNEQLDQIKKKKEEIWEIISFKKKASNFLEEIYFDDNFGRLSAAAKAGKTTGAENTVFDDYDQNFLNNNNTESFSVLLRQLNLNDKQGSVHFKDLHDYATTLDEIEKRLLEYKTVLIEKTGNK